MTDGNPERRKLGKVRPEGTGAGSRGPHRLRPGKRDFRLRYKARSPGRWSSRSSPAMLSNSDAVPDPEAPRPPAPRGHACHPLPWALSAALLLFAATCAACAVSAWAVPRSPASPGPSPAPSSRFPEVPELPPDARARLPVAPQVRCAPAWTPGGTPAQLWEPFSILRHPGPTIRPSWTPEGTSPLSRTLGVPLLFSYPPKTASASRAPGRDLFTIADPQGHFFMSSR